ncbi:MAG TPA: GyrI-like domain-containing protein [Balneolaceae bacterium]|nr:GyrI-like domain-containing protein [Balneolaceae bacterium]|tara:strand:+ start:112008 stop:112505 length:498 start_codon:yes stop_codon:yes gene_type:complete
MNLPQIEIRQSTKIRLAGLSITSSLASRDLKDLWMKFRRLQKDFQDPKSHDSYSVSIYRNGFDPAAFTPNTIFKQWAATKVDQDFLIPDGLSELIIPTGTYAVFMYKGTAADYPKTARLFHTHWLPENGFITDDRPNFEILGPDYLGPMNPDSEEQIWIPIKKDM